MSRERLHSSVARSKWDSYGHHQDASSVMPQHSGQAGFPRRPPAPRSRPDDSQRVGRQRAADGLIAVAAKINLDDGIMVGREGFHDPLDVFHADVRLVERKWVRNHLGCHQRDASTQAPGQVAGGCERSGGLGEIGENDLEIKLAAAAEDIRLRE